MNVLSDRQDWLNAPEWKIPSTGANQLQKLNTLQTVQAASEKVEGPLFDPYEMESTERAAAKSSSMD